MRLLHDSQLTIHNSQFFDLSGKIALITGGGTGIGRGIALALARRGAHVVLVGRRPDPLLATAAEAAALGVQALPIPLDIGDAATRRQLLPAIRAEFGGLDILVHNAGVLAGGPLAERSAAEIDQVLQTNLTAAIDLTRLAQDELMQRRGALVFVGSAMAFVPMPNATLYAASKAGLHGFAQAIRYELEPAGVRVLAAYPPGTETALVRNAECGMRNGGAAVSLRSRAMKNLRGYPLEDPVRAGERIVVALVKGRRTLFWGGERWLIRFHGLAPRLVERALTITRGWFVW